MKSSHFNKNYEKVLSSKAKFVSKLPEPPKPPRMKVKSIRK